MWEGERAGAMMSGPLISGSSQTAAPFQFPFIVLEGRVAFFYLQTPSPYFFGNNPPPRRLQFQPSSPFNFNPVTFTFNPRHLSISTSSPFNFQTSSLFHFLSFSLMVVV
jgi:hypothetical protein